MSAAPDPLHLGAPAASPPAGPGAGRRLQAGAAAKPILVVWFATLVFSTGPVMIAAASVSGPVFSFWRLWMGVVIVGTLAVAAHRRAGGGPIGRRGITWTVLAGVAFAVHQLTLMIALRTTTVVDVSLMNTLAPLVVAVFAARMFHEHPGPAFRLWSLLAIVGAAAVAVAGSSGPQGQAAGVAFAAANVVFYSLYFVCSKRAREDITTLNFLAGVTVVAAVLVSVVVLGSTVLVSGPPVTDISAHDLVLCLAVAAIPGLVGHFSMTWSLKWVPANVPPVVMLAMPLLSGTLAWLLLGQSVTAAKVAAGAVTLVGVAGAVRASPGPVTIEALDLAEET